MDARDFIAGLDRHPQHFVPKDIAQTVVYRSACYPHLTRKYRSWGAFIDYMRVIDAVIMGTLQ